MKDTLHFLQQPVTAHLLSEGWGQGDRQGG